jgi:hypothetical protein
MHTHTPGPWIWKDDTLIAPNAPSDYEGYGGDPVVVETDSGVYPPRGVDRALIAAAPELLEALKKFQDAMLRFGNWDDGCFYYNNRSASELQRPIEAAWVAIAKAEGR